MCTTAALGVPFERCKYRELSTLSGGEQKRLVLEYLLRGPDEVLLLDEPDNYLDVPGKIWMEEQIRASDKTILYISHAIAEVARLAAVSPAFARRAYDAADHDPLLFLLRSIRLGFGTLKLFLRTKSGPVRPPEAWTGIQSAFQALSVTTAQRVVRLSAQAGGAPDARDPSGPGR